LVNLYKNRNRCFSFFKNFGNWVLILQIIKKQQLIKNFNQVLLFYNNQHKRFKKIKNHIIIGKIKNKKNLKTLVLRFLKFKKSADNRTRTYTPCGTRS
jgi:hypothetical protein